MNDWATLNAEVVAEFRANGGHVARFEDVSVVIVHTIGARSGLVRETPLIPVLDEGDMAIFATAAGSRTHPAWCFNLRATPRVTVEYGSERFTADVVELSVAEAARRVSKKAEDVPQLAKYVAAAAPRAIPVFVIRRTDP